VIDHARREVRCATRRVELSRMEWALLTHRAADPVRVFTERELLRDVWGYKAEPATRTLDAHAGRLRRKLEGYGAVGYVLNCRGVGYRLVDRYRAAVDQGPVREAASNVAGSLIEP
jgi:DNA-binding response OmpR family regulator